MVHDHTHMQSAHTLLECSRLTAFQRGFHRAEHSESLRVRVLETPATGRSNDVKINPAHPRLDFRMIAFSEARRGSRAESRSAEVFRPVTIPSTRQAAACARSSTHGETKN